MRGACVLGEDTSQGIEAGQRTGYSETNGAYPRTRKSPEMFVLPPKQGTGGGLRRRRASAIGHA